MGPENVDRNARCSCGAVFAVKDCLVAGEAPAPPVAPGYVPAPPPLPGTCYQHPAMVAAMCQRHPSVAAMRLCTNCHAPICDTCDFPFPGGIHLCPTCATNPNPGLTHGRKVLLGWAMGLSIWSTVGLVVMFSGALQGTAATPGDVKGIELLLGFLVGIPAIIAGALGLACLDKRMGNPPIVWVTAIWSGLLLGVWLLMSVIGTFM